MMPAWLAIMLSVGESDMLIPDSPPLIRIDRENREIVARQWVQTGDGPRAGYWQEQELVGIQAIATGGDRVVPLQWK